MKLSEEDLEELTTMVVTLIAALETNNELVKAISNGLHQSAKESGKLSDPHYLKTKELIDMTIKANVELLNQCK